MHLKEHPDYKYRPRRKPKSLMRRDKYPFPMPMFPGMAPMAGYAQYNGYNPYAQYPCGAAALASSSAAESLAHAAAQEKARAAAVLSASGMTSLPGHMDSVMTSKLAEASMCSSTAASTTPSLTPASVRYYSPYAAAAALGSMAAGAPTPANPYMMSYPSPMPPSGLPATTSDVHRSLATYMLGATKPEDFYRSHMPSLHNSVL